MPELLEQVYDTALQLSQAERGELAVRLIDSLPENDHYREEWKAELTRRIDELQRGKAVGIPMEEVFTQLRERFP